MTDCVSDTQAFILINRFNCSENVHTHVLILEKYKLHVILFILILLQDNVLKYVVFSLHFIFVVTFHFRLIFMYIMENENV